MRIGARDLVRVARTHRHRLRHDVAAALLLIPVKLVGLPVHHPDLADVDLAPADPLVRENFNTAPCPLHSSQTHSKDRCPPS